MDTKYPSNLDPKLKEAYERVMGLGTPAQQKNAAPQPAPAVQSYTPNKASDAPPAGLHMVTEEIHTAEKPNKQTVVHLSGHAEKKKDEHKTANPQNSSGVMPVILGVIAVLFFIGYALFWAQIFGISILPF